MSTKPVHNKKEFVVPQEYFEYVSYIKENPRNLPVKPASYYLKKIKLISSLVDMLPSVVYLLDYRTTNYLFLGQNCEHLLGYTRNEIMKDGSRAHIKRNMHPTDMAVFSSEVFTKFLEYTRAFPKNELKNIRFSVNFRYRRKDNTYIHVLQQYFVLDTDEKGYPILTFGTWTDISGHKTDDKVVFSVTRFNKKSGFSVVTIDSFPVEKLEVSSRESDIIKLLVKGHSSKEIGRELHISLHTVNAHRRNILKKTGCKNTADLVHYAVSNGIT